MIFPMHNYEFQEVYDVLSFSLACMGSCTMFLWMRVPSVAEKYKTALLISGMVTFIATYHYIRIFNSWVYAYHYPPVARGAPAGSGIAGAADVQSPRITGVPFNDAYRYMDWLLTVPLLLMEIIMVMNLAPEESRAKQWNLGIGAALMIVSGYRGELVIEGDLSQRWASWCLSMCFFLYVVYTLLIDLSNATNSEPDPAIKKLIKNAQLVTVVSWCTYPIVYLFPMLFGHGQPAGQSSGPNTVVCIQIGYCTSDVISKCLVGLMIYQISNAKSRNENKLGGV